MGEWVLRPRGLPKGRSRALEDAGVTAKLVRMQQYYSRFQPAGQRSTRVTNGQARAPRKGPLTCSLAGKRLEAASGIEPL